MMNAEQFRNLVVKPTLWDMAEVFPGADNPMAVELLMGTAAHESHLGTYLAQVGGPALGVYQMEPVTHKDLWRNYLAGRPPRSGWVMDRIVFADTRTDEVSDSALVGDLRYATVMARLAYYRHSFDWPDPLDPDWLERLGEIWKRFYNTASGKGTVSQFVADYTQRVGR